MNLNLQYPVIAARWQVIPRTEAEVVLHAVNGDMTLRTAEPGLLPALLGLLDGSHPVDDIVGRLSAYDESSVLATLEQLAAAGALEEADPGAASVPADERRRYQGQLAFFSYFTASAADDGSAPAYIPAFAAEYQRRLREARVAVWGLGRLGAPLARALAYAGVGYIAGVDDEDVSAADTQVDSGLRPQHVGTPRVEAVGSILAECNPLVRYEAVRRPLAGAGPLTAILRDCTFAVLCPDIFRPADYLAFNLACLETGTPWTSCRSLGFDLDIGPSVIPHKTPCYRCFDLRQKSNLPDYEAHVLAEELRNTAAIAPIGLCFTPGIGLVALEVVKAITEFMQPASYAHLCSLNLLTGELKRHPILKIPRCPDCGRTAQGYPTIQAWQQQDVL